MTMPSKSFDFSKYATALEHIAKFPGCNKSVIARQHGLKTSDLLEAIIHWFGNLSGLDEDSFREVSAAHNAGADTKGHVPVSEQHISSVENLDTSDKAAPKPVRFSEPNKLPEDFVIIPPATAAGTRGYDAILRSNTSKPQIIIPRPVARKLAIITKVGGPSETLKAFAVDLLFSESTRNIMVRRRDTPGGFMFRADSSGNWGITSQQLKKIKSTGKVLMKIVADRCNHVVFAPIETGETVDAGKGRGAT